MSVKPALEVPSSSDKTLVFVPTYNERDNAVRLIQELLQLPLNLDLLFIDDNSPDGTGEILDSIKTREPRLHVLHRKGKLGIGSAHLDGIRWAYDHGYMQLVTMDCDFTHPPECIPNLLAAGKDAAVAVGSRYIQKKSLSGWNAYRRFLTMTGHFLTRILLGMEYDATGGFRFYQLEKIPRQVFDLVGSRGYSFFFESLYIIHLNRFKIAQIPIHLPVRTYGSSKMDSSEVFRSVRFLFAVYFTTLLNRERLLLSPALAEGEINLTQKDEQGWDDYWKTHIKASGILYDFIAALYRKFLIRPALNHFIEGNFKKGATVLHAGCGSGQVDTDVRHYVNITALDISVNALRFYRKTNQDFCKIVHGSIFDIPFPDHSVDGAYNLGVMEHFTEAEISKILRELKRVIKPGGRMVLFWPPEFGLSVLFFKGLKWFFCNVLGKKDVKFHPDEITRVRSFSHVKGLLEESGLEVKNYYFGIRDFFTYSVIVAEVPVLENSSKALPKGDEKAPLVHEAPFKTVEASLPS